MPVQFDVQVWIAHTWFCHFFIIGILAESMLMDCIQEWVSWKYFTPLLRTSHTSEDVNLKNGLCCVVYILTSEWVLRTKSAGQNSALSPLSLNLQMFCMFPPHFVAKKGNREKNFTPKRGLVTCENWSGGSSQAPWPHHIRQKALYIDQQTWYTAPIFWSKYINSCNHEVCALYCICAMSSLLGIKNSSFSYSILQLRHKLFWSTQVKLTDYKVDWPFYVPCLGVTLTKTLEKLGPEKTSYFLNSTTRFEFCQLFLKATIWIGNFSWATNNLQQLKISVKDHLTYLTQLFFLTLALLRSASFWPPSMVYISVNNTQTLQITFLHDMLPI